MAANLSKSITSSDDLGTNGTNKKKVPRSSELVIDLDKFAAIWWPDCFKNYRRLWSSKFTCCTIFQADSAHRFVTICRVSTDWAKREFCLQERRWNLLSVSPQPGISVFIIPEGERRFQFHYLLLSRYYPCPERPLLGGGHSVRTDGDNRHKRIWTTSRFQINRIMSLALKRT